MPKVSVLMPSRNRVEMAKQSIDSLGEGDYEVLMYVDADDNQLEDYKELAALNTDKVRLYVKMRVGYDGFHTMINFLSSKAHGDWLMLWNDDAVMQTPNWTSLLPEATKPEVVNIFSPSPIMNWFPLISRQLFHLIGHYSHSSHCDSWVQDLANATDIHTYVGGIQMQHLRDQITDETKTYTQSMYEITSPKHSSDEMMKLMQVDINKVRNQQK